MKAKRDTRKDMSMKKAKRAITIRYVRGGGELNFVNLTFSSTCRKTIKNRIMKKTDTRKSITMKVLTRWRNLSPLKLMTNV
jgi:hypothetical protein